jgi:ABC-type nickel/cobalt efflux system permease component RcnA
MEMHLPSVGSLTTLGLGLLFGLKHATEVDHVVAVSTIVSDHRTIWRSALVGALWGAGHTLSLLIVGMFVICFRVAIPLPVATWLELGVAFMISGLGLLAVARALCRRRDIHFHRHDHNGQSHFHVHFHDRGTEHEHRGTLHSHAIAGLGLKPFLVGGMHGLAGSAALTLLLLTQIQSTVIRLLYLLVFGLGSVCGMLAMSSLIGLPFAFTSRRLARGHFGLQAFFGTVSVVFGLWYAYQVNAG